MAEAGPQDGKRFLPARNEDCRWDNGVVWPVGVYISVPFCRTKCSLLATSLLDVFSRAVFSSAMWIAFAPDIQNAAQIAKAMGGQMEAPPWIPSIWAAERRRCSRRRKLKRIFEAVRSRFEVNPEAEVTVECAPRDAE